MITFSTEATPNRVGAGCYPAPPTPPGMRVRTGRFRKRKHASSSGVALRLHPKRADTDQAPVLQPCVRHPGLRRQ